MLLVLAAEILANRSKAQAVRDQCTAVMAMKSVAAVELGGKLTI